MSDRDAWIRFFCSWVIRGHNTDEASKHSDYALEKLREREKQKMFDRAESGYRDALEYPEYK